MSQLYIYSGLSGNSRDRGFFNLIFLSAIITRKKHKIGVLTFLMIDFEWIQSRVIQNEYYYSKHGDQERKNDKLSINEVEEALI